MQSHSNPPHIKKHGQSYYRYPSSMENPLANSVTTVTLVSNLHCSSCVSTIEDAVLSLNPRPLAVEVSIVLGSVTVWHDSAITASDIRSTILAAGFDVAQPSSETEGPSSTSTSSFYLHGSQSTHIQHCEMCRSSLEKKAQSHSNVSLAEILPSQKQDIQAEDAGPYRLTLSVAGMTCSACTNTVTRIIQETSGSSEVKVSLLDNSAVATVQSKDLVELIKTAIDDAGYEVNIVSLDKISEPGPFDITLSVGGMTCSSCTRTVTELVSNLEGVEHVSVSLLDNSAVVTVSDKRLAALVAETIEDAGYDCRIVQVEQSKAARVPDASRTVTFKVEGMFCKHCPEKIISTLKALDKAVVITRPFESHSDPLITVTYHPSAPHLTVRTIAKAIASTNDPPFHVSVHHPPSIEDLARHIQRKEQHHYLMRFVLSVLIAIPTFVIGIVYMSLVSDGDTGKMFLMAPMWAGNVPRAQWALLFLATPAMFFCADVFHRRTLKEVRALWRPGSRTPLLHRFFRFGSMNMLVSTGVSIAYFASIILLILASQEMPEEMGSDTTYFDSVVFLTMFLLAGRYIESYSKTKTADAIRALSSLRPAKALLVGLPESNTTSTSPTASVVDVEKGDVKQELSNATTGFSAEEIPVDMLEIGDVVRVTHGSTPPADGTIVSGQGITFDESSLTGESKLVKKTIGDQVFLGTINKAGLVHVRVDKVEGGTFLDNVLKVVREGQRLRAPIERVADVITGYFVPVITAIAVVTWVIWLTLGLTGTLPEDYLDIGVGGWAVWSLRFSIAVFIVACPCGIGLAAPTALLVASGVAAKNGILSRGGGEAFQEMSQVDLIAFDKTGTITKGCPQVTDFHTVASKSPLPTVLGIVAELESSSSHPLATAICDHVGKFDRQSMVASTVEEIPGRGMRGQFADQKLSAILGNEALMRDEDAVQNEEILKLISEWKSQSQSVVLLALRNGEENEPRYVVSAAFAISDEIREEAKQVINWLQSKGKQTWLISGDSSIETVKSIARQAGIPPENIMAGVMPHEKAQKVTELQSSGEPGSRKVVAMVGDGINDSPALAAADIGIAIGSGSDVAISSASFILLKSDLRSLITLWDLSKQTIRKVKTNFLWALVYNMAAVPIAAGVIYPYHHARLDPVWASLAMALSSVSVVLSSLLLRLYRPPSAGKI